MKKFIIYLILISSLIYLYINQDKVFDFVIQKYIDYNVYEIQNEYTKNKDYLSFKKTTNFTPSNKEELINVLYTILDDGMENFSFICKYDCENDIYEISNNEILNTMNNYVHPFNSFKNYNISMSSFNIVNTNIIKNYNDDEITLINSKLIDITNNIINNNMNNYEKIKAFHDYIITNTKYDNEEAKLIENGETNNIMSHKAYNVLINNIGICSGYTDTLALFLNYLDIDNFKVSTKDHIWNVLYIDNEWKHIDMTWDDPSVDNGSDMLIHDFFLKSTDEIQKRDLKKHDFDKSIYKELN